MKTWLREVLLSLRTVVKRLMKKYGEEVQLCKRITKTVNNQVVYEYSEPVIVLAQIEQIIPYDYILEKYGSIPTGDYLATFLPEVDVNEGDLIIYQGQKLNVENVIYRRHKGVVIYKEAVLRKK